MRLLFVGDVVGRPGREALAGLAPALRAGRGVAFTIVNGENSAAGLGISPKTAAAIFAAGADVITTGNHVWRRREALPLLESDARLLRPANYPARTPGRGWGVYEAPGGGRIGVVNLAGQLFMERSGDPVETVDRILAEHLGGCAVVVDFHAEATGEKAALLRYLDGRVAALVGTHTHVQTADETVTPAGTAFITDAGMTGPVDSVIGLDPETALRNVRTALPQKFKAAGGDAKLEGVIVDLDPATGRSASIERLRLPWKREPAKAKDEEEE